MLVALALLAAVGLFVAAFLTRPTAAPPTLVRSFESSDPVCTVTDERLGSISGMAAREDGTWVLNDRGSVLYRLDSKCKVDKVVDLTAELKALKLSLTDIEDLAAGPDGWLWLSDSGGNVTARDTVTIVGWRDEDTPVRTAKLRYSEGKHDAEALVVDMVGRATLVTKVPSDDGPAQVFRTNLPVATSGVQELQLIGTVELAKPAESTSGSRLVTGAAMAPGGTHVVLRTYTNAWEFTAPDGDLAQAIVSSEPQLVPLPKSEQGEAITYSVDGSELLATGESLPAPIDRVLIRRSVG